MFKKESVIFVIFIVILFISMYNVNAGIVITDASSEYSTGFFNITAGSNNNYTIYVNLTKTDVGVSAYNVTFFLPYGMKNQSACDGLNGFRNINLTTEACTINSPALTAGTPVTLNLNITATISAFTRFLDTREYIIVNATNTSSTDTNVSTINPSGIYGYQFWINPRPYAVNNSFNNASLKFIAWGQLRPKYEAWVPLYTFNSSSNRTVLATNSQINIIYADKPFFNFPTYFEMLSYSLNFTIYNTTVSSDAVASFQIKTSNYDKSCQILSPLQTITNAFTDPMSNTTYNQTVAFPYVSGGVFDVYYNGTKYNTTNLTTDYGINLSYSVGEAATNTILNITAPTNLGNISLAVPFTLIAASQGTCTPVMVESQNISGFDPVSNPPNIGDVINNSYVISIRNNLSNFTLTNMNIHFIQPINVTINATTSQNVFNITKDLIVTWKNNTGSWTNSSGLLYATETANFRDNLRASVTNNKNLTVLFQIIDLTLNSSSFNNWNPGQNASNVTINMSSQMIFPVLQEVNNVSGAAGAQNSYNVTVSMSAGSTLKIPTTKLNSLTPTNCPTAIICNINISIDGIEIPAQNYTIGSITTTSSLSASTHTVSVSYTVPASSSSSSSSSTSGTTSSSGSENNDVIGLIRNIEVLADKDSEIIIRESNKITFKLNNISHEITVKEVKTDSVTLEIKSNPIIVVIRIGETANVDTDGNGLNDIAITLKSVSGLLADLSFRALEEKETLNGNTTLQESKNQEKENIEIGESAGPRKILYILLVIVVILISIIWIINKKTGFLKKL